MQTRRIFRPKAIRAYTILVLIIALLLYWSAARAVQGIDLSLNPPSWLDALRTSFPLLDTFFPLVYFVSEMLHWSVIRHVIPLILGAGLAHFITLDLIHQLYDLPARTNARDLLRRLQGRIPPFQRPLVIQRLKFTEQRVEEELLRVGGPGLISLPESDAAVTEINGRFERVLHPSRRHKLRRFEKIVAVLDLREQERYERNATLVTKEGLELGTDVYVNFRLQRRSENEGNDVYSVNDEAVRKAAYNITNYEFGASRWDNSPLPIAVGVLRGIVSKLNLQNLIDPNQAIEGAPHPGVQRDMERTLRGILRSMGIELLEARITAFTMSETMRETLVDYYKGFLPRASLGPLDPNADSAQSRRKKMRDKMIKSIASGMENLREDRTVLPRSTMRHLSQREALGQNQQLTMMQMMGMMQQMLQQIPQGQAPELNRRFHALQDSLADDAPRQLTAGAFFPSAQDTVYDETVALEDSPQQTDARQQRLNDELASLDEF